MFATSFQVSKIFDIDLYKGDLYKTNWVYYPLDVLGGKFSENRPASYKFLLGGGLEGGGDASNGF